MSPCEVVKLPDGGVAILCSRGRRGVKRCAVAGCGRDAPYLCDFPLTGPKAGQTCDRPLCSVHARQVGPDRHYCYAHPWDGQTVKPDGAQAT